MAMLAADEDFWIRKHGIKLSALVAWGKTHSETLIWDKSRFRNICHHYRPRTTGQASRMRATIQTSKVIRANAAYNVDHLLMS
jgi:hypothetical protein